MKNLVSLALALVAGVIAVSCGSGQKGGDLTEPYRISFDLSTIDRSVPFPTLSEMIEDIEYVKLETPADLPVGSIYDRPTITDNHIVFMDRDQGVLQFSRDGKFIRRVGSIGRGPGEYLEWGVRAIRVDEERGIIHCIDSSDSYGIMRYDLATGKFIERVPITEADGSPLTRDVMLGDYEPFAEGVFLASHGDGFIMSAIASESYFFVTLDMTTARITHREPSRVYYDGVNASPMSMFLPQPAWHDTEGRMTIYENGADTMYVVGKDFSMTPRIVADLGGRGFKVPTSEEDSGLAISDVMGENDRYIVFVLGEGQPFSRSPMKKHLMSFDKTTGERSLVTVTRENFLFSGPENDIDGGFSHLLRYDGDRRWWSYDAYNLIEILTPEHFEKVRPTVKYPDRLEKLQALVATLKEEDNPVIAIARVKR